MAVKEKNRKNVNMKCRRQTFRAKQQSVLSVVSVRISDEEKNRIDEIMRAANIKRYSDVMRLAIRMVQVPKDDKHQRAEIFH